MPIASNTIDIVFSTCLFHHINDPLKGFTEVKRVMKSGGRFVLGMPTDPGMLNRLVKELITFRKARRIGLQNPELIYALEHKNHIGSLIEIVNYVFEKENVKWSYKPFIFKSWNFNLSVYACISK